ncbi:MAG: PP2C family protein-serine/threonine phosphatase [Oscillospiraceae bacterium]|nr:PP2C family protein-serine/threonine phosphatase [Oscillospiraceae bacterium]
MTFDLTAVDLVNIIMIASGLGVTTLCIMQIERSPFNADMRRFFYVFLWNVLGYMGTHLARELLDGHGGIAARNAIVAVTFVEFLISGSMAIMLSLMMHYMAHDNELSKGSRAGFVTAFVIHSALLAVSQFTGAYYYFDEYNSYHRGSLYALSNLLPVLTIIYGIILLVRHRDKFEQKTARAFWIYLLAPLGAVLVQIFLPGIQFVMFATVGASINMFGVITSGLMERYEHQRLETARIDTELSMATRIQSDMLPNIFPAFPEREDFDIYASMDPAKEVGGDFYDFFLIDEDHLALVMADVSGKGVPAALFMMASKILIQNFTMMYKAPKAALEATNYQICQRNGEEMFVTVWLGILDLNTGVLTASNAGHEYPFIRSPGGRFELYRDKHGFVVGGMPQARYKEYEVQLEKGSMVFVYTDGVAEATNSGNELFGTDRLLEALNSSDSDDPVSILENVDKSVNAFVKDAPQFDDLTMLCLKYNGKA